MLNRLYVIQFTRYRRASRRKLLNYITLNSICQELFSSFFKLFRGDFPSFSFSRVTRLFYHIFSNLSSTFFELFRSFSSCEVALQASAFHHTTFSLYLNKFHLSRTFFSFFQISLVFGIISLPSRTACVYYHMLSHLSRIF